MIWLFERGNEVVRLETRFDRPSGDYTILIKWSDATEEVERYSVFADFHARILVLEHQLDTDHWTQVGPPEIIPGDWRGPSN